MSGDLGEGTKGERKEDERGEMLIVFVSGEFGFLESERFDWS